MEALASWLGWILVNHLQNSFDVQNTQVTAKSFLASVLVPCVRILETVKQRWTAMHCIHPCLHGKYSVVFMNLESVWTGIGCPVYCRTAVWGTHFVESGRFLGRKSCFMALYTWMMTTCFINSPAPNCRLTDSNMNLLISIVGMLVTFSCQSNSCSDVCIGLLKWLHHTYKCMWKMLLPSSTADCVRFVLWSDTTTWCLFHGCRMTTAPYKRGQWILAIPSDCHSVLYHPGHSFLFLHCNMAGCTNDSVKFPKTEALGILF